MAPLAASIKGKEEEDKKGDKVQFEVRGQPYFLSFVAEEGRWFVFTPASKGVQRIPVVDDEALPFVGNVLIDDVNIQRKRSQ